MKKSLLRLKIKGFRDALIKGNLRLRWAIKTKLEESILKDLDIEKLSAFRGTSLLLRSIEKCIRAWKRLKEALINAFTLIFLDFILPFILYVNGSKEKGYEITLHQIGRDKIKKSILFLFKSLFDAEIRYWATKLEVDVLIWVLTKLSKYFDESSFIVITNHMTFKTALQRKITERRSAWLNKWAMYLFTFLSRMTIVW